MRSVVVVITDVVLYEAFQMPLIQDDHMVEKIPAAVADPTFRHTVLPRTSETGPFGLNAEALHCIDHLRIKAGAAIKDEITGRRIVRERLAQLLNHPGTCRVLGHITMQNAPPVVPRQNSIRAENGLT